MSSESRIEWTERTWNPTTGCTKVSAGCTHCYAEVMARRLHAMGARGYERRFELALHEDRLAQPLLRHAPTVYFVNSMSDLFHARVPRDFVHQVFQVMVDTPQHTYQILTKRSRRLRILAPGLVWPPNVWMGVSVEDAARMYRVDDLRLVPAAVRFLSCEPLLGTLAGIDLTGIGWVIAGGESGPGHRKADTAWITGLRDECTAAGVPFFFKQWGGRTPKAGGRELDGRTWDGLPARRNPESQSDTADIPSPEQPRA